jgi:homopolymeric O-antigen transport system permease protein
MAMSTATTEAPQAHETVIAPPSGWAPLQGRELWSHWELIYFLTKRELQVRYKQSAFGVGWAILQPLALAFIFALFFSKFLKFEQPGVPYAVLAVIGIVPWLFTANAVQNSAGSLVMDANLISKVYFPRLALPIAKALSLVVDLVIAVVVVVLVILLYGVTLATQAPLVLAFLGLGVVTAFALGTLLAAVNVKYRDVSVVTPMLIQVAFFLTPVLYPGLGPNCPVKGNWQYVWALNPMVSVVNGCRWALVDAPYPGTDKILISCASALFLLVVSIQYFQRAQRWFADLI